MQLRPLRQATAGQQRLVGPFVDDTDFKTAETALTIANTDVILSLNGGPGAPKDSGGGTHRNNGMYALTFNEVDSASVGGLEGSILIAGALIVPFTVAVLEEAVWDALYAPGAPGFATVAELALIKSYIDTEMAAALAAIQAVKAITDQMTFNVPNLLDVNTQRLNNVDLSGSGIAADPMRAT